MGWFSALFAKGDEGIREWVRFDFERNLKKSKGISQLERRLSAVGATINDRDWMHGLKTPMENCIFEGSPFVLTDQPADLLAEYVVEKESTSGRGDWLVHHVNKGVEAILEGEDPQIAKLRAYFLEWFPSAYPIWRDWLTDATLQSISERMDTSRF
jgi:hypothetical protein